MFGIHVSKDKRSSLHSAIAEDVKDMKLNCVQIFTHGPKTKSLNKIDPQKLEDMSKVVNIYVHSTYVSTWETLDHIHEQLNVAQLIGAKGLVLHLPKALPNVVVHPLRDMLPWAKKTKIILEMRALKQADDSYESPEKILALIKELEEQKFTSDQVGICIDTAHIYAGKAQIQDYKSASEYLAKLDGKKEWITLLHLNGNEYDAKIRAGDKHCFPFSKEDKIWNGIKYEDSGLRAFVEWFLSKKIDIILELDFASKAARDFHAWLKSKQA